MSEKRDYYEVLGVSRTATQDEIKKAFRKLSRQYHPDVQQGKSDAERKIAEEKFKEVAEAYDVLSNDEKRERYNQFGFSDPQGFGGQDVDLGEFFRRHSGMFADFFDFDNFGNSPFGGHFSSGFRNFGFGNGNSDFGMDNPDSPKKGRDIQVKMRISLKECIFGTIREFDLPISVTCPDCNGSGHSKDSKPEVCSDCHGTGVITESRRNGFMVVQSSHVCEKCHGSGRKNSIPCGKCHGAGLVQKKEHFSQKIDPGIISGQTIGILGKGEGGRNRGANGNLIILLDVEESDKFFSRSNNRNPLDLYSTTFVSPLVPLFGGKIEVITPYGPKEVQVQSGITNGSVIDVKDCGIKAGNKTGTLHTRLVFDNLAYLSSDDIRKLKEIHSHIGTSNLKSQRELLEKFKNSWQ